MFLFRNLVIHPPPSPMHNPIFIFFSQKLPMYFPKDSVRGALHPLVMSQLFLVTDDDMPK